MHGKGTLYANSAQMQRCLTSSELKLKKKQDNIAGLQLAEFLISPAYQSAIEKQAKDALPRVNFNAKIQAVMIEAGKYYQSGTGKVEGYGQKWLP